MTPSLQTVLKTPGIYDAQTTFDSVSNTLEDRFGIMQLSYAVSYTQSAEDDPPILLLNYPDAWVERYVENNYFMIDPVLRHAEHAMAPFLWSELDWTAAPVAALLKEARAHGVGQSGFSIPIQAERGASVLISMASTMHPRDWKAFATERRVDLELIAFQLHQALMMSSGASLSAKLIGLSTRETDVLQCMGNGMTNEAVAKNLGITERTVRAHL